jgi:hypothetical protein
MTNIVAGLALLVAGSLCGCEGQAVPSSLQTAKVSYLDDGSALVAMDGKAFNYGFTGLERFCLSGANLHNLDQKSVSDLERLAGHYGLCRQDTTRQRQVLAELARRSTAND